MVEDADRGATVSDEARVVSSEAAGELGEDPGNPKVVAQTRETRYADGGRC